MDDITILNQIIEAEKQAQAVLEEALNREKSLGDSLSGEVVELRNNYAHREDARIDKTEEEEIKFADGQVQKTLAEFDLRMKHINDTFKKNRERWIDEIFRKIISATE